MVKLLIPDSLASFLPIASSASGDADSECGTTSDLLLIFLLLDEGLLSSMEAVRLASSSIEVLLLLRFSTPFAVGEFERDRALDADLLVEDFLSPIRPWFEPVFGDEEAEELVDTDGDS